MAVEVKPEEALVIQAMPDPNPPATEDELFTRLAGATIVQIGTPSNCTLEGGGLIIDYRVPGSADVQRLAFGFNENGMWLEYDGPSKFPL